MALNTAGVTSAEVRRRSSAQKRLRREADRLDQLPRKLRLPKVHGERLPVAGDSEPPTLTAAQLRLAADLLDHPGWGEG